MPFFPQSYLTPEPALFQILSALEDASSSSSQKPSPSCHPRIQVRRGAAPQPHFTPRFDVAETSSAYELYGEVPGLTQSDLSIEFSDAQTLVIKGKTQRPTVSSPEEKGKGKEVATHEQEHESATTVNETASETSSHHATVEDEEDEYDQADVPVATPATTTSTTTLTKEAENAAKPSSEPQSQQPKARYWVAERRVGEFARSFSFEQRIDQDGVRAELRNGVLHVSVPKNLKRAKVLVSVQ